jgi:hypothetical protein
VLSCFSERFGMMEDNQRVHPTMKDIEKNEGGYENEKGSSPLVPNSSHHTMHGPTQSTQALRSKGSLRDGSLSPQRIPKSTPKSPSASQSPQGELFAQCGQAPSHEGGAQIIFLALLCVHYFLSAAHDDVHYAAHYYTTHSSTPNETL